LKNLLSSGRLDGVSGISELSIAMTFSGVFGIGHGSERPFMQNHFALPHSTGKGASQ
jgi:hypothetical protein